MHYTKFYPLIYYQTKQNTKQNFKQARVSNIASNHLSGIDFNDFMNLYKKCTAKTYSFKTI